MTFADLSSNPKTYAWLVRNGRWFVPLLVGAILGTGAGTVAAMRGLEAFRAGIRQENVAVVESAVAEIQREKTEAHRHFVPRSEYEGFKGRMSARLDSIDRKVGDVANDVRWLVRRQKGSE